MGPDVPDKYIGPPAAGASIFMLEIGDTKLSFRDILLVPNLLSILRVALTPIIGYFLWLRTEEGILISIALLALAGLTDFLDGFLARRWNQISALGIIIDPLADKLFALVLVAELVIFRSFPLWLAVAVISRDLLIVTGGAIVLKSRDLVLPSNLTGKYYFASLALLIVSHIINFRFGIGLYYYLTVILLIVSTINYARIFWILEHGGSRPVFADKKIFKNLRSLMTIIIIVVSSYYFYLQVILRYIK
ncbi:putative CDP-diacylglycerol--glycerol-3-phosphate 3-phosphatidyltransferase [Candidatus Zixiibacteriota bacterium]|nr:putative CDP-diacylglycerol--glycerol-3-phosphate 3-phosphatidyltransferase [candidate division Zixibacteria bacterium]